MRRIVGNDNSRGFPTIAAIQYLKRPELNINTVAALMGSREPSAFHRSFRKWRGRTPGGYHARDHVLANGP